jgi:ubiquinone/menaquinone biosynthesis C-methylase UbiE
MMPENFDAIARWYGGLETMAFGNALQRCRTTYVEALGPARSILIAGEGNGRFLRALLRTNRDARVTVVDASRRMLELARCRAGSCDRVRFVHGNLLDPGLSLPPVDAVVTHFFLDCFDEPRLRTVVARLRGVLRDGGVWVWSDFMIPDRGLLHWAGHWGIAGLYACAV